VAEQLQLFAVHLRRALLDPAAPLINSAEAVQAEEQLMPLKHWCRACLMQRPQP